LFQREELLEEYTQQHFLFTNTEKDIPADCLSPLNNDDETSDVDERDEELILPKKA
jgi:hypothetical protein